MDIARIQQRYGIEISSDELERLRRDLTVILLSAARAKALQFADFLAATDYPLAFIYLEILQPAIEHLSDESNCSEIISSAQIHVASAYINSMTALLYHSRVRGIKLVKSVILVSCVPQNLHSIGPRTVADLLEEAHYRVIFLDPPTQRNALIQFCIEQHPAGIALSVASPDQLNELWTTTDELRQRKYTGFILAGGAAFFQHINDGLLQKHGIDLVENDPLALIDWLGTHLNNGGEQL